MNYAVLINSCNAYADLWKPFFFFINQNWPLYERINWYINTESINDYCLPINVKFINTELKGIDLWGKRLINSLKAIQEEFVIVLMDDFFLKEKIDLCKIEECITYFQEDVNIATFYLVNIPNKPLVESKYKPFSEISKGATFRLNSAPAIWRKQKLLKYLKEKDNPWAWEFFGTCRTNHSNDRFFCVGNNEAPIYNYAHAVYRGRWLEEQIKPLLDKYDFDIKMSQRGTVGQEDPIPKRSFKWKVQFMIKGLSMVGIDALFEMVKVKINEKRSK